MPVALSSYLEFFVTELQKLREQLDELQEENRQLKEEIGLIAALPVTSRLRAAKISPDGFRILNALRSGRVLRTAMILAEIYPAGVRDEPENVDITFKVQLHRLRKALRAYEIEIENVWGVGYRLSDDSIERAAALIEELTT